MLNQVVRDRWMQIWDKIDGRNQQLGWKRYDWADLDSHPLLQGIKPGVLAKVVRNGLRVLDLIQPMVVHRLLGVPKQIIPTAYFHVGMSYLLREKLQTGPSGWDPGKADAVCEAALERRYDCDYVCWDHPYHHHSAHWRTDTKGDTPPSCAHHTTRLGRLLLEVGSAHQRADLSEFGISAARALLNYHSWRSHEDGTSTVSYYPFTEDETINVCADAAALLALLPAQVRIECQDKIEGLTRMICKEQLSDGSWNYCTARHYQQRSENQRSEILVVDNHHTGELLQALAVVFASGALPPDLAQEVRSSVTKGLAFYVESFFEEDGTAYYFANSKSRKAHITGFSEGMGAIYHAIASSCVTDAALLQRLREFVPRLVEKALQLYDPRSGDVACAEVWGKNYHIQSLRWGSGPLMETIMYALVLP